MARRVSGIWAGLLVLARTAGAGDAPPDTGATEATGPSVELLEFLADWQDADGNWVDPLELPEMLTAPPPDGGEATETGERDE